jgi:Ca2+-binding RTX toxin-like protein
MTYPAERHWPASTASPRTARALVFGCVGAVALAISPAAEATVSCNFTTDQVNVQMTGPGDVAKLEIGGGGTILVDDANGPIICGPGGPPTVTNTQTVAIADTSDNAGTPAPTDGSTRVEIFQPSAFVPGASLSGENGGLGEIEFALYPNDGSDDTLRLWGVDVGADTWVMGDGGINWNAGESDPAPDPEITATVGVDHWNLLPQAGDDRISAQGGSGTGAPFSRVEVSGGLGDDVIEGGGEGDQLSGAEGNDVVRGFDGADGISDEAGNDVIDGGADVDELNYYGLPAGVNVDLSRATPQNTGGAGVDTIVEIEDLNGTEHADALTGNAAFNYLYGNQGDDTLDGGAGDDALTGGAGTDTVTYGRAPSAVTVNLADSSGLGYGNDGIADVENLIGSPFSDSLTGSDDANSISGLAGADVVAALAGPDSVHVRDHERDTVSCGTELDTVSADRLTLDGIDPDCETVLLDQELGFELSGKRRQRIVKRKRAVVTVSCPLEDCEVTLRTKSKGLAGRPVTKSIAAGVPERATLRLSKRQLESMRRALAGGIGAKLRVKAQAVDAADNLVVQRLVVRAKR